MRLSVRALLVASLALLPALAGCQARDDGAVRFSTWGSIQEMATLEPLLAEFERENPDVRVELVHIPEAADYPHKLRLMIAAGHTPDVMFMDNQDLAGFAEHDVFRDLGPVLGKGARAFFPQALSAMSWHGHLYGVPRDLSNLAIFYNERLFDAAHVPYPEPGWTLDDMRTMARKLTGGTGTDAHWGISFSQYPLYWLPYLWSMGADVMDPAMTRCTLEDPRAVKALRFYTDLRLVDHVAPTEAEMGNARPGQLFAQGKLAMLVGGRWIIPGYRQDLTFPWDVAPFPRGPAGSIVDTDASGWCIAKDTRHFEQAWRLVTFLAGRQANAAFAKSGLIVPARPDVADSPEFLSGAPAHGKVFLEVIPEGRPTLSPPAADEITYELIDDLNPVWEGLEPLEEGIAQATQRIDAILRESS